MYYYHGPKLNNTERLNSMTFNKHNLSLLIIISLRLYFKINP